MEKETADQNSTEETKQEQVVEDDLVIDSNEDTEEREQEKSKPFSKLMKMLSFSKKEWFFYSYLEFLFN